MTGDISADLADWYTTEGDAMTHDEYEAGQDADGERRMQRALDDEHEARQAAVSKALSEPLHVTNWRPLLAPEDVDRLIDTADALRADNERLLEVVKRALAVETSVTQGQERELRVGYVEMLRDAARKEAGNE
jgi:hypothetical protein